MVDGKKKHTKNPKALTVAFPPGCDWLNLNSLSLQPEGALDAW